MSGKAQQQSRLKELIARGREQGYLTYAEVNDHLPEDISDPEQVEDIIRMINDMGITVFETAPVKAKSKLPSASRKASVKSWRPSPCSQAPSMAFSPTTTA